MTEKSDFGPAKPEGRRQNRPGLSTPFRLRRAKVEFCYYLPLFRISLPKEVFFSYRFLGTIAQVTVT